ncbi:hypothetical protein TNCV_470031 [Trichonephila clavipes]|nr:hypothetical protein TNCV_470031 [Trichonephila clavipes]
MPKRSSLRDVGTSSYSYHIAACSPASVLANRRTNDTIFVASMDETVRPRTTDFHPLMQSTPPVSSPGRIEECVHPEGRRVESLMSHQPPLKIGIEWLSSFGRRVDYLILIKRYRLNKMTVVIC